ncbi:MAG TPA: histidinol-phosphate transaminase [Pirellulales bacterium]|nr:histidinol-phosphate transaminase [Pirellulales bacterium]
MRGYTPGEQPRGGKYIKLNTNENPYPSSPAVQRAIGMAIKDGLQKYPDPLGEAFRVRAGQIYGFDPSWILCGNGSDDILTIVTRAFVGQGERLRLPYPSYILYKTLAQLQGAEAEEVRFTDDWRLDERFSDSRPATGIVAADRVSTASASTGATPLKLAFLPNPNSPSGTFIPVEEVRQLARRLPCPLLVDEAYADFAEDNCLRLVREEENVLVSRTLSKSYALAGLRFGFLVARPELIEQLIKVKDSYNCDALSLAGATAAIDDQAWLAANRTRILATRAKLIAGLRDLGFDVLDSHANFVWCTHRQQASQKLYLRLKEQQILVRYMDYPGWGDGLRITVGTDEQVEAAFALLKAMV